MNTNMFTKLADALLLAVQDTNHRFVLFKSPTGREFGFTWQAGYSGLMALPPTSGPSRGIIKQPKQGLFDIHVDTGNRYGASVTHRHLLNDLIANSSKDTAMRVWRGEDPLSVGRNTDEQEALIVQLLLMFEQEINWGGEEWQKNSNFNALVTRPDERRPRDMLMGYILQAFGLGVENVKFWMTSKPGTLTFRGGKERPEVRDFRQYCKFLTDHAKFFIELRHLKGGDALMTGQYRARFREAARRFGNNPRYQPLNHE
jgi:hypothetical protein